jgi:hypothetical protein
MFAGAMGVGFLPAARSMPVIARTAGGAAAGIVAGVVALVVTGGPTSALIDLFPYI